MERRYGEFSISEQLLKENPDIIIKQIMSRVLPLKVEFDYVSQSFVYTVYSPTLRELTEGEAIPKYYITLQSEEGEIQNIEFEEGR